MKVVYMKDRIGNEIKVFYNPESQCHIVTWFVETEKRWRKAKNKTGEKVKIK